MALLDPDAEDCSQSEGCLFIPDCPFYETCRALELEAEETNE